MWLHTVTCKELQKSHTKLPTKRCTYYCTYWVQHAEMACATTPAQLSVCVSVVPDAWCCHFWLFEPSVGLNLARILKMLDLALITTFKISHESDSRLTRCKKSRDLTVFEILRPYVRLSFLLFGSLFFFVVRNVCFF